MCHNEYLYCGVRGKQFITSHIHKLLVHYGLIDWYIPSLSHSLHFLLVLPGKIPGFSFFPALILLFLTVQRYLL